jgi:cell division protein FtsI (penicillin-binding protein 3)
VDPSGQRSAPQAAPFKPGEELPTPLPVGAHRVIATMTAAQMRKMMEGVVLYGTGRPAQLNGYSSGGKTGTAQKVDPATHLYSKTMHIASFAGIAPVNNPVISVAVVIDDPKGGSYYGTAVSAPVFAEVAQKVLEYLGVPHDRPLVAPLDLAKQRSDPEVDEDAPSEHTGDLSALFTEVNNLPADDPLRAEVNGQQPVPSAADELSSGGQVPTAGKTDIAQNARSFPAVPVRPVEEKPETPSLTTMAANEVPHVSGHGVVVDAGHRIGVPSFLGEPLRVAVETAATSGLALQIVGSGTAREQVPAPGSKVPPGTEIVVRFTR